MTKSLVDADACPVKHLIVSTAKHYQLPVLMFLDTSHVYEDGYSTVFTIDKGRDGVDYALISHTSKGDLVITQDYGVATMALAKGAYAISQNGLIFSADNMNLLLTQRYEHQKLRAANKRVKGPKKRTKADDDKFVNQLNKLLQSMEEKK